MTPIFPPPPFGRRVLVRTVVLWISFRVAAVVGGGEVLVLFADLEGTARPSTIPFGDLRLGVVLALLVGIATLGEGARRSELLFLANLGWSKSRLAVMSVVICLALEFGLQLYLVW